MIGALAVAALLVARPAPSAVTIATARGERVIELRDDAGGAPMLSASGLVSALGGTVRVSGSWAEIAIGRQPFRFLLGAPFLVYNNRVRPLAAGASLTRDTLYLPFQFIAEVLPKLFADRYRY